MTPCRASAATLACSAAVAATLLVGTARAESWEFWPEANLYETLGPTTRLLFLTALVKGKDMPDRTLDVAGYLDVTPKPVFWPALTARDWQRKRYFWARVGYGHSFKTESGERSTPEDRGVVALHARAYLPAELLLEGRARVDLRWIGGDYSTRYRLRGEVNREFAVRGKGVTPYLQVEAFYDTRYDGWSRQLYQLGAELEVTRHFRVEPYVARQIDRLPASSALDAVGLVARWIY